MDDKYRQLISEADTPRKRALLQSMMKRGAIQPADMSFDDAMRSAARGVPIVGSWMDEITAGLDTAMSYPFDALNSLTGREYRDPTWRNIAETTSDPWERYERALNAERARDMVIDTSNPEASAALKAGGAIVGSVAGGLAGMRNFPNATAAAFSTVPKAAGAGAVIGGATGAGEGEGGWDRAWETALGAGIGGAAGAASVPLSRAASWASQKIGGLFGLSDKTPKVTKSAMDSINKALKRQGVTGEQLAKSGDPLYKMTDDTAALARSIADKSDDAAIMFRQATANDFSPAANVVKKGVEANTNRFADAALTPPVAGEAAVRETLNVPRNVLLQFGEKASEIYSNVARRLMRGDADEIAKEAARLLLTKSSKVADDFTRFAASQAKTEAQKRAIHSLFGMIASGATEPTTEYATGGKF